MAFCGDREDVVSMAATAALQLLEGSGVTPADIGRWAAWAHGGGGGGAQNPGGLSG
jgi:hypothetical protein